MIFSCASCMGPSRNQVAEASNAGCITRLRLPDYPPIADAARIEGDLEVEVVVGSDQHARSVSTRRSSSSRTEAFFLPAVEEAVRASVFGGSCTGAKVILAFHFVVDLQPHAGRSVSFGFPNEFWISVPPRLVQP